MTRYRARRNQRSAGRESFGSSPALRGPGQGFGQNRPYVSPWQGGSGHLSHTPTPRAGETLTPAPSPGTHGTPNAPGPKPPVGHQPEFDEQYFSEINSADRRLGEDLSYIAGRRQRTASDFGIDDPTNPGSRAAGLKRAFLASRQRTGGTLAQEPGQLYSGAFSNAMQHERLNEELAYNDLRQQYADALAGLTEDERQARYGSEDTKKQAFQDWLGRAPEADVGDEPAAEESPAAAPGAPKPKGKGKGKGKKGTVKHGKKAVIKHTPRPHQQDTLRPRKKGRH